MYPTKPLLMVIFALGMAQGVMASDREITVTASEFAFEPDNVSVETGEEVRIVLENAGAVAHDLTIEALGVASSTVQSGNQTGIEFTAPEEPGSYRIICSIPGHAQAGMEATLEVQ